MGSLVPNPNDMEVINALNSVFSDPRLTALRTWMTTAGNDPNLFAAGRHLHRIAYRLNIHPTSGAGTNPRGRWFKFLQSFLNERPDGAGKAKNHDIILTALDGFVSDPHCAGIHFWGDLELEAGFIRDGANLLIHSADFQSELITKRS